MKKISIAETGLEVSRIALGCMRLGDPDSSLPLSDANRKEATAAIRAALDEGINLFDHADIYGHGRGEQVFAAIWDEVPSLRGKIILQSKCGIRPAAEPDPHPPERYDFSYEHIMRAVEGTLTRLKTDYLDILLLHRPDPLVQPEEVARAFDELHSGGKVRHFGVSNHTAAQIELLRRWVKQPLTINQVEISLLHSGMIDDGVVFNQANPPMPLRNEGTLEYCRLHNITLQAWGPLGGGLMFSPDANTEALARQVVKALDKLAKEKGVSREAIAIAWVLRHPAGIQAIIGSTKPDRIRAACQADGVELTREEWYDLFIAGRGAPVP